MARFKFSVQAADVIFAIICLAFPFGWSVSGLPPSIVLACVFWALSFGALVHLVWNLEQTERLSWKTKAASTIVAVLAIAYFGGPRVAEQYRKERLSAAITAPQASADAPTPVATRTPTPDQPSRRVAAGRAPKEAPIRIPAVVAGPGSIVTQGQTGGTNTINAERPWRKLDGDQVGVFVGTLKGKPIGKLFVVCQSLGGREPCEFARQLAVLLRTAGWDVDPISEQMAFGPPEANIPELYVLAHSPDSPSTVRGAVLLEALATAGFPAVPIIRADTPPDELVLWVNTRKAP